MAEPKNDWRTLSRLFSYLQGEQTLLFLVLICVVIYGVTTALGPAVIAIALDENIIAGDREGLQSNMIKLAGIYLLGYLTFRQQLIWLGTLGQRILVKLRSDIFEKMQGLSLGFYSQNEAGDLMSRLINDSSTIGNLFQQSITQTFGSVVSLISVLVVMFALDWRLSLATCSVIPFMLYLSIYFARKSRKAFEKTRKSMGELSSTIEENLRMVRESQSFVRQALNIEEFQETNAVNRDANVEAVRITAAFSPTIDLLSTLATVIVISYGGYLAFNGMVTIGVVVAFLSYSQRFFRPISMMASFYTQLQSTLAASDRVFEIIDSPKEEQGTREIVLDDITGEVTFDHVWFGYYADQPVLKDFTVHASPGETVAFIGETGVGKSTAMTLIPRYYSAQEGVVSVDGHDVKKIELENLRSFIGEVPQTSFLFSYTIAQNIAFGVEDPDMDRVIQAAELAQADGFIRKLPQGYDTPYGADGTKLSQGQRQLICIARAIYADPRILLLDEATSNIDNQTERHLQEAVNRVLKDRTSFVIAHRLSTIKNADQIIVLGKDGIIERGDHESLLNEGGYYARMIEGQAFIQN